MGNIYRENLKKICGKIEGTKLYKSFIKNPWPYFVGTLLLSLINIYILYYTQIPLKVSGWFSLLGGGMLEYTGIKMKNMAYYNDLGFNIKNKREFFTTFYTFLNVGIIMGSFLATLWASEFKIKKIKSKKQGIMAISGGILMGYSSRIVFGCNIGAFFSAIPSYSLHGWVFGIATFIGAYFGIKILLRNI